MAWLQNLAGKAEDLLIRIDKNAATVLSEANPKLSEKVEEDLSAPTDISILVEPKDYRTKDLTISSDPSGSSDNISIISEKSGISDIDDFGISFPSKQGSPSPTNSCKQEFKAEAMGFHSKSSSLQNSFISLDDYSYKMEEKLNKLEIENETLHQQLNNMRHTIAETQNENTNLQNELDRAKESVLATQTEMEQYRARAQRVLQEKEKLIALREVSTGIEASANEQILLTYNEELKKELKFQEEKRSELSGKLYKANEDLSNLQRSYITAQREEQGTKQKLHEYYNKEASFREAVEAEYLLKAKELQTTTEELAQRNKDMLMKSSEIAYLKEQLKKRHNHVSNEDLELRIQSITQTLMHKQDTLETITTERNALLFQLEKYEKQHYKLLSQLEKSLAENSIDSVTNDNKVQIPYFLKISPFDAGVTRKVKRAYSSLDALSVRTGVFLRRYPLARVLVFWYMALLHLWVLFILWTYVPPSSSST